MSEQRKREEQGDRMSASTNQPITESSDDRPIWPDRPRRHRGRWVLGAVIILAAAGVTVALTDPFRHPAQATPETADNASATSLATVSRRTLSAQIQVNGTLEYADSYAVINKAPGTITALPDVGTVIRQGQILYRVDGLPVVLLYGSTPMYRTLAEGATASDITGSDVRQLNAALVALGYADRADLDPSSDEFSWATKAGVKKLQEALGLDETGVLTPAQIVFLPVPLRITEVPATLGSAAPPGAPTLKATSTTRHIAVNLDASQQASVKVGDVVTVTLPDNSTTPGRVSSVGTVATTPSGGAGAENTSPTISVDITLTDPKATGKLDKAPVLVSITTETVKNALVVPVTALVALAGGGYAVEVAGSDGVRHLVPVSLGIFDDAGGFAQVTGSGLSAGQRVVVPGS